MEDVSKRLGLENGTVSCYQLSLNYQSVGIGIIGMIGSEIQAAAGPFPNFAFFILNVTQTFWGVSPARKANVKIQGGESCEEARFRLLHSQDWSEVGTFLVCHWPTWSIASWTRDNLVTYNRWPESFFLYTERIAVAKPFPHLMQVSDILFRRPTYQGLLSFRTSQLAMTL